MARWKRAATLAIVVGAAAISAGAASGWTASADGAARDAIEAHFAAQGIDPATVVWQEGPRNYAGPKCPGPAWNCTTSRHVVQFSQTAQNVAQCSPEADVITSTDDECVIVQLGPGGTNNASCTLNSSTEPADQTCDITQTGDRNTAHIDMNITQSTGPAQEARQRAFVEQTATERNDVHVTQTVSQRTSLGPAQTQDAYQLADILQTATGSDNFSHVHQSQDQSGTGNAEEQAQNTNVDYPEEFDCDEEMRPEQPNQCARVDQNITSEDGGKNESHLHQAIGERQSTSFGTALNPAQQQQGSFGSGQNGDFVDSGQEGDIDQTNPFGAGSNHDVAHEDQRQRQSAPKGGADQTQLTDPNCCGASQQGGIGNREYIKQSVTQSATEDDAFQFSELKGQAVQESGPSLLSTFQASGTPPHQDKCRIMHHGRNNSGAAHFQEEASPCPFLRVETTCTSGGEVSSFGEGGGDEPCTSDTFTEPPGEGGGEGLTVPVTITFPTTPTFGLPIEMPSFGEPPDFPTVPFGP